jgi:hypothetical protein
MLIARETINEIRIKARIASTIMRNLVLPQLVEDHSMCAVFCLACAEAARSACMQCPVCVCFKRRMRLFHSIFLSLLMPLFILAVIWLCHWERFHHGPAHGKGGGHSLLPRRLKPRTPLGCPACCLAASRSSSGRPEPVPVRPWQEVKSRRGASKRVQTAGFACPNRACVYDGMTDAEVHAASGRWSAGPS